MTDVPEDILHDIFDFKEATRNSKPAPGTIITFVDGISGNLLRIQDGKIIEERRMRPHERIDSREVQSKDPA